MIFNTNRSPLTVKASHVTPHAKLTRDIDRQQKGPKPVFGVTLRRGQELSIDIHANIVRPGSIKRCHRRRFFQRKSLAEAVEHAFARASGLRAPDILLGQGSVYARFEQRRGDIQRRIDGSRLDWILRDILDKGLRDKAKSEDGAEEKSQGHRR